MQSISPNARLRFRTRWLARSFEQRVTISRGLGHPLSLRRVRRTTECVTPCSSRQRRSGTTPLVRAHRDGTPTPRVGLHAGADAQQPKQDPQERLHRRLPRIQTFRLLSSKIAVDFPVDRGVLIRVVPLARDNIRPVLVRNGGRGAPGGRTRHVMQSTSLPGAAGVFAGM